MIELVRRSFELLAYFLGAALVGGACGEALAQLASWMVRQ
jgi:hypothetical protein